MNALDFVKLARLQVLRPLISISFEMLAFGDRALLQSKVDELRKVATKLNARDLVADIDPTRPTITIYGVVAPPELLGETEAND